MFVELVTVLLNSLIITEFFPFIYESQCDSI